MELELLGWNALSIGFFGTIFFTFPEGWGLWQQNKTIWKERSGKSISITWIMYYGFMFCSLFIYGVSEQKIALIFNGLLTLLYIPLLIGLWKFKGYRTFEKLLLLIFTIAILMMIIHPRKDYFFLAFSLGSIVAAVTQPIEMLRQKSAGVVEIKMLTVFFVSTMFWTTYAFAAQDWVLKILCPAQLILLGSTILLWCVYQKKTISL